MLVSKCRAVAYELLVRVRVRLMQHPFLSFASACVCVRVRVCCLRVGTRTCKHARTRARKHAGMDARTHAADGHFAGAKRIDARTPHGGLVPTSASCWKTAGSMAPPPSTISTTLRHGTSLRMCCSCSGDAAAKSATGHTSARTAGEQADAEARGQAARARAPRPRCSPRGP